MAVDAAIAAGVVLLFWLVFSRPMSCSARVAVTNRYADEADVSLRLANYLLAVALCSDGSAVTFTHTTQPGLCE